MPVNGIGAASGVGAQKDRVPKNQLDQEAFMKLFIAQLRAQNPSKPLDSAAMLQQMSSLAAMTSSQNLDKTIQTLNANLKQSQMVDASQLIGKKVQLFKGVSPLIKGEGLGGGVFINQKTTSVTITIRDQNNNVVQTIEKPVNGTGVVDFEWDGRDKNGQLMEPGMYKISASAIVDGKAVDMETLGDFKIGSVTLDKQSNTLYLNIDDLGGVEMDKIVKILNSNTKEKSPWELEI